MISFSTVFKTSAQSETKIFRLFYYVKNMCVIKNLLNIIYYPEHSFVLESNCAALIKNTNGSFNFILYFVHQTKHTLQSW